MQPTCFINHGGGPCVSLDPGPLRAEGVPIVGSGRTYCDVGSFMGGSGSADPAAEAFGAWLREAMTDGGT